MSAPPWAFACIISLINALHADRCQERFWHIVGPICVGVVGFIISMCTDNVAARYIALFLQASSYAGFIVFYSWISSSFPRPPAKRAVAIAMINAFSQLGNVCASIDPSRRLKLTRTSQVAGSYVWNLKANGYRQSYGIVLSMFGITIFGCVIFRMVLTNLNKKLAEQELAWEPKPDVAHQTAEIIHTGDDEALKMIKGFRYLV